jgi:NDP-sugar pyrophosphorylase family protein
MKPELLIMAAGLGSRFGGLKQLEPVGPNGEKVMDYALYDARRAGVERVVFVIRKALEPEFRRQIGEPYRRWMDVAYAFQELDQLPAGFVLPGDRTRPWGTAHAVLAARDQLQAPFIVINADDFYGRCAFQRLSEFLARPSAAPDAYAMVAFRMANTLSEHGPVARGICQVDPAGLLRSVTEHTGLARSADGGLGPFTGQEPVSMNIWGFHPSIFAQLQERFSRFLAESGQDPRAEFFLPTAVDGLIREGRATVQVLESEDRWFGVTYREDKASVVSRIQDLVRAGEYPSSLWS